jgi:hypothetical protein
MNLERCANPDGRLVCTAHRTMRSDHYQCAMCDTEVVDRAAIQEGLSRNRWLLGGTIITFLASFFLFMSAGINIVGIMIGLLVSGTTVFAMMRLPLWTRMLGARGSVSGNAVSIMMRLDTFRREYIWLSGGAIFTFVVALFVLISASATIDGTLAGLFGLLGVGTAAFTMKHSGTFRRGIIRSNPTGIQALYWAVALPGIFMGIVFVIMLIVLAAWAARERRIGEITEAIERAR